MIDEIKELLTDTVRNTLSVNTFASPEELSEDDWDNDYNCSYSKDGTMLLDAENFPGTVKVREGTRIICNDVFSFQDYMDDNRPIGSEIPEDERVSFLDKIYLPASIMHIGERAFKECGWLRSIRFPKSLETIRDNAFYGCWELRSISCPATLLSIGEQAFFECFSLEHVRLNKNLRVLGAQAFGFCESLKEITLPEKLEVVGPDVFVGCTSLKKIYIPKGTKDAFMDLFPEKQHKYLKEI